MVNIQKKLEKIQQEQPTIHEVNKDRLSEILSVVQAKKYQDPSTYYPQSPLSRMLPNCYPKAPNEGIFKVNIEDMKMDNLHEETLFYIFYTFPGDKLQTKAYDNILKRKYIFCRMYKCFVTFNSPAIADHVKRLIVMFDPFSWSKVSIEVVFDEKFIRSLER
ncbi:general negative regulator of transcription [Encephalitozoon intestinalis ATCC 50506]|uniref:General negative regulator of transcription n=1 Tax=Encephalitozoon intestinalis (strain ATCC 50506) TaxID=876142 RepID=E0S5H2_ENCIT|nr:general negative regulator of transcription [Encephalitozoon intestinalis ATCC 50506]ADM10957.1 general negative regulator of transcription [Encephalitozoon intestinalis ATCC 50506]UTX44593.1 general negative regulator of transcription [Encephalitozoon intestinalis]